MCCQYEVAWFARPLEIVDVSHEFCTIPLSVLKFICILRSFCRVVVQGRDRDCPLISPSAGCCTEASVDPWRVIFNSIGLQCSCFGKCSDHPSMCFRVESIGFWGISLTAAAETISGTSMLSFSIPQLVSTARSSSVTSNTDLITRNSTATFTECWNLAEHFISNERLMTRPDIPEADWPINPMLDFIGLQWVSWVPQYLQTFSNASQKFAWDPIIR